jgi:hypothetical protein
MTRRALSPPHVKIGMKKGGAERHEKTSITNTMSNNA